MPVKQDLEMSSCPRQHPFLKENPLRRSVLNMKGSLLFIALVEVIPNFLSIEWQLSRVVNYVFFLQEKPQAPQTIRMPRKENLGSKQARLQYSPSQPCQWLLSFRCTRLPAYFLIFCISSFCFLPRTMGVKPAKSLGCSSSCAKFAKSTFFLKLYFLKCSLKVVEYCLSTSIHSYSCFGTIFPPSNILGWMIKASDTTFPLGLRKRVQSAVLLWGWLFLGGLRSQMLLVVRPWRNLQVSGPATMMRVRSVSWVKWGWRKLRWNSFSREKNRLVRVNNLIYILTLDHDVIQYRNSYPFILQKLPLQLMLTKREFSQIYDQAVITIRQIKNSNDNFNKNIGVANEALLAQELEADEENLNILYTKTEQHIEKMQQSYLDPDTARKIGTVKQQLRIQKDRRNQISKTIQEAKKNMPPPLKEEKQTKMGKLQEKTRILKSSQITQPTEHNASQVSEMVEINDFDYEMERKLIHEKNKVIGETQEKLVYVNHLAIETASMVHSQGEKLDIIGEEVFGAYKNLNMANEELNEANKQQRKGRKKYILLMLLLIGIVTGALCFFLLV